MTALSKTVYVEGRGEIQRVGTDDKGLCAECHVRGVIENYSAMWHDGDIVCPNCNGYMRMYDAG